MEFVTDALRIRYPLQPGWAVDGADLRIVSGQVTWITGAIGSGTSTLLLALAGLAPRLTGGEQQGSVTRDGDDPAQLTPLAAGIGYLGPSPALQISGIARSVRDEIAVGPVNLGHPRDQITAAVTAAMRCLRVDHLADRGPATLSGGETQRMLLAALLATSPRAWLLDEPFSALDQASIADVQRLLRAECDGGATIVVACEDADCMLPIADRLIVLRQGRIALDGDPSILLAGDALAAAGAGTTDAASLARLAQFPAPRPLTRQALLERVADTSPVGSVARVHHATDTTQPTLPVNRNAISLLEFDAVDFAYPGGVPVLAALSLQLHPGEALGLFGANGAGKSTLLRLAMALEQPGRGLVTTLRTPTTGRQPEDFAPRAGFLFQQPERQLFASSVQSECSLAPGLAGWDPSRIRQAVAEVLEELGLTETAEEHPYDLPLPRRRLVALASILAADPDLLLLDEPTAALDATSRELVIRVVRERVRRGKGVLAITHDATFAHEALDRGSVIEGGQVVHAGPIRTVIDDVRMIRPAALAVAIALGLPAGHDRREEVADTLRVR